MLVLPRPVKYDKFGARTADYDERTWFLKIQEEIFEAFNAPDNLQRAEELTDVITVCTSYLAALGFDQNARDVIQSRVNDKNDRRGYFKED